MKEVLLTIGLLIGGFLTFIMVVSTIQAEKNYKNLKNKENE